MTVQTSYSFEHAVAYQGQIADLQLCNTVSKLNKSGATIPFGYAVIHDGDDAAKIAGAVFTGSAVVGIVARELNRAYADGDTFGAPDDRDMTVVTSGVIWATTVDSATIGGNVYADQDGTIRATAGATGIQIPGAKFASSAGAGELVKVSLNIGG